MYDCKILADSISATRQRLTTFEISYPYIIHAEIMTHRMFSRNTQSSRATPVWKNVDKVEEDPFVPLTFRQNQKGMADGLTMSGKELEDSEMVWNRAIHDAIEHARALQELDVHKALANRVLGPYQWFRMILTATDFDNFFALRCHPEAQAEIRTIAEMMQEQYDCSVPYPIQPGEWHLPLVDDQEIRLSHPPFEDWDEAYDYWKKISIGRCARVSYLTHDGRRDPAADIALYERLLQNGHMSPFEHVARPFTDTEWRFVARAQDAMNEVRYIDPHATEGYRYIHGSTHPFVQLAMRQIEYAGNFHGWWSARMNVPHQHNYGLTL